MRILALDPATECGWAYLQIGGTVASGTWDLSTRRDESGGMKLLRFESKLREVVGYGIDLIVFEAARHGAPKMAGALVHQAELQAIIKRLGEEVKISYRGYSPAEIKKFATGKGNAGKPDVCAAVRARFGYAGNNYNEADALALLHLAKAEYAAAAKAIVTKNVTDDEEPF